MDQHVERILRQIPGWSISDAVNKPAGWRYNQPELPRRYWWGKLCAAYRGQRYTPARHRPGA